MVNKTPMSLASVIDPALYISLLQDELRRLRTENYRLELQLKSNEMRAEISQRRQGASGILGVSQDEAKLRSEYTPPRNLTSDDVLAGGGERIDLGVVKMPEGAE